MKNYMVQIKTKKIITKQAYNLPKYRIKMINKKIVLQNIKRNKIVKINIIKFYLYHKIYL